MEILGKTVNIIQNIRKNGQISGKPYGNYLIFAAISLDEASKYVILCMRVSAPVCRCTTITISDAIRY